MRRLSIRPATAGDGEWLFALHEAAMRPAVERDRRTWDAGSQRARFVARPERDVRVVELDGDRVAAVRLDVDPDGALRIGLLEVDPAWQRQGIGTKVIEALDEEAARSGAALTLRVRHGNEARRLYERLGFAVEAEDDTHAHLRRS